MEPQDNFPLDVNQQNMPPISPIRESISQPAPQKSQRRFLRLSLLVVGSLVIAGGVYAFFSVYSQQAAPQETSQLPIGQATNDQNSTIASTTSNIPADWKTCLNSKYGYQIKYPSNWNVYKPSHGETKQSSCEEGSAIISLSFNLYDTSAPNLTIDVSDPIRLKGTIYEGSTSLEDYFTRNSSLPRGIIYKTGLDREPLVWTGNGNFLSFHDGSVFIFRFRNIGDIQQGEILSSFRFDQPKSATQDSSIANNQTSGSKIYWYQQSVPGFEIEYPVTWSVINPPPKCVSSICNAGFLQAVDGSGVVMSVESVSAEYVNQTLNQFLDRKDKTGQTVYGGSPSKTVLSEREISLDGTNAIQRIEMWNATGFKTVITYVKKSSLVYEFQLKVGSPGNYSVENLNNYNQILSTFKFTK